MDVETGARSIARHPPVVVLVPAAAAALYLWLVLITTVSHPGAIGINYNTLGTDWMVFHGAIRAMLDGQAALIFDGDRFTDFLNTSYAAWLSRPLEYRPWAYPPSFLVLLLPFAPLGFVASFAAFQIATATMLAAAVNFSAARHQASAVLPVAMALLCPAATINVIDGQCAFLVAALMVGGFHLLGTRPVLGGLVLGVLSFKPQFCLLIPFALIAAGQWRALLGAGLSALALMLASAVIFGAGAWFGWFPLIVANLTSPDPKWIAYGRMWGHSVYTCAVLLGASPRWASLIQMTAMLGAVISVVVAFRSPRLVTADRTAVILAATILAAPHSGPYDAMLLVIAAALWLTTRPTQSTLRWTLVLLVWLVPLLSPPALVFAGRLMPLLTLLLIGLLLVEDPSRDERAIVRGEATT